MIKIEDLKKNLEARLLVLSNDRKRLEKELEKKEVSDVDKKTLAIILVQSSAMIDLIQQLLFEIDQ